MKEKNVWEPQNCTTTTLAKEEKHLPFTQVIHVCLYIWLSTSLEVFWPLGMSKATDIPYLKSQYVFCRNKGKVKCHKVIHYFKRCSSNLTYIPVADLVPCCHDTGSLSGFRDISRLPLNKSKTQFCHISNKKPVAGVKGLSLDDRKKGNNQREMSFVLPLPVVWCSRSPGPPCLWDGHMREHSHAVWTSLSFSCSGFVCDQSKPWYNKLLRFSFTSMKDAMILSLETTSFSVLNDILYTFYHTLYISVKVIRSISVPLRQSLNCTLTLRSLWTA